MTYRIRLTRNKVNGSADRRDGTRDSEADTGGCRVDVLGQPYHELWAIASTDCVQVSEGDGGLDASRARLPEYGQLIYTNATVAYRSTYHSIDLSVLRSQTVEVHGSMIFGVHTGASMVNWWLVRPHSTRSITQ